MTAEPVTATVHIDAPPERVYEYLTRAGAIVTWMGECALPEAEPGGRFHPDIKEPRSAARRRCGRGSTLAVV
jgi:uncharacterized protein YndB with AHSA1/START domain